jgi:hypothetical protein
LQETGLRITNLFQRLRSWLQTVNADGQQNQATTIRDFTTITSLIVTGLISNIIATFIAQEILGYSFPWALIVGLVIVLSLATVLQVRGLPFRVKPLQIIAFLLTLGIVQAAIIAYLYISNQPLTTYLIFDATESTAPYYGDLIQTIRLAAQVQHPKSLGGLRVYGGQLNGQTDCRDTTQLIAPVRAEDFEHELDMAFGSFDPKGNASLTTAVLEAVRKDLKYYRGPIKLIIITSGIDPKCEPQLGGIFEAIAEDIRANLSQEIKIAIVGIGDITPTEEATLRSYADAFNGTYLNGNQSGLDSLLLASPSYFNR